MSFAEMLTKIQSFPIDWKFIFGALIGWLGTIQVNRIREKERAVHTRRLEDENRTLQAKLDKTVNVYRVQFETEFRSFLAVWGKFADVRGAMAGLRPHMEIGPLNANHQERQERLTQRLKELADAINALKTAVYHHSPFYPEEIYKDLLNAIEVCDSTHDEVLIEGQESEWPKDWYKRGEEQFSELVRKGAVISSKIRQRIESLSGHE